MVEAPQLTPEQRKELEEKLKSMSPQELLEFQKKQCIFCQIIKGAIPSKKVFEDEQVLAILDINPAARGHILLLPKEHYAIMPQIPEKKLGYLFNISKNLSQIVLRGLKVSGTNLFIANGIAAGQRAQHFMIHIIPRKETDGLIPITEKIIDKAMQENIRAAIEPRLLELLQDQAKPKSSPSPTQPTSEEPRPKKKSVPKKEKASQNAKPEPEKKKPSPPPSRAADDAVSLDDIANLFK